jgi:hypothetical protein
MTQEEQQWEALVLQSYHETNLPRETSEVISVASGSGATGFELDASGGTTPAASQVSSSDLYDPGIVIEREADDGGVLDSMTDFRTSQSVYGVSDFSDDTGETEDAVMGVIDAYVEKNRKRRNLESFLFVGAVIYLATVLLDKK